MPIAILLGGIATIALLFNSLWRPLLARAERFTAHFANDLEVARLPISASQYAAILLAVAIALWAFTMIFIGLNPLLAIAFLAASLAATMYVGRLYVGWRRKKRIAQFQDQLETTLRTLAGAVRVGLGIRQAFALVAEQSLEPTRYEFTRVIGINNVGVSILDALDQLAGRMTNPETRMLARVIRVQSKTGGDLASVLDNLAATIRDRRRLARRVNAITAQGRATGWLLGMLPIGVGMFIVFTQPMLRDGMLLTPLGRILLAASLILDAIAVFTLSRITKVDA